MQEEGQEREGPPAFGSRVLQKGMRGEDVELLQERLRLAGFVEHKFAPGVFDDKTERALLEYQRGTAFLRKMYAFEGLPGKAKPYADAELCRQLLKVPGLRKVLIEYKVKEGDSLWRIASNFGIGPDSLALLNGLSNESVIHPGQTLFVVCDVGKAEYKQ